MKDFDTTEQMIEFPADGALNVSVYITINDDEIDEAEEQYFIVYMEVFNATNLSLLINDVRNSSTGIIVDNDGKLISMTL